jgi:hypothetical protein
VLGGGKGGLLMRGYETHRSRDDVYWGGASSQLIPSSRPCWTIFESTRKILHRGLEK